MSAVPRPKRQACSGEIINYYVDGDPSSEPVPVTVLRVLSGTNVNFEFPKIDGKLVSRRLMTSIKHVHDEAWDLAPLSAKQNRGAWDFHPVYGPLFDKNLAAAHARAAKQEAASE